MGQSIVVGGLPSSSTMRRTNNDRLRHAAAGTVLFSYFEDTVLDLLSMIERLNAA